MQEVLKNGSEGEVHVADTIEDLIPHIQKSLLDSNVKYVKVFSKIVNAKVKFNVEEEKKDIVEKINEFHFRICNNDLFLKWCKKHSINRFNFSFSVKGNDVETCDFFDITNGAFYTAEQVEKEMGEPVFSLSR